MNCPDCDNIACRYGGCQGRRPGLDPRNPYYLSRAVEAMTDDRADRLAPEGDAAERVRDAGQAFPDER